MLAFAMLTKNIAMPVTRNLEYVVSCAHEGGLNEGTILGFAQNAFRRRPGAMGQLSCGVVVSCIVIIQRWARFVACECFRFPSYLWMSFASSSSRDPRVFPKNVRLGP